MQLSWCQTGGQRGDAPWMFCQQGQNLLKGKDLLGTWRHPFAQTKAVLKFATSRD